ncbi:unnamed protein product [Caenorhabditis nigoni]
MLEAINDWTDALDAGKQVDILYFDYAKAFDRVPHCRLLDKLLELKFNRNLICWIKSFLINRVFRVKVGEHLSNPKKAECGVPQGSVISPVLFGVYVNSISQTLPPNVYCKQFADDLKLYAIIDKKATVTPLHTAITAIAEWSDEHKLALNKEKTISYL